MGFLLALGLSAGAALADVALSGRFIWDEPADWFGGFSAIEVSEDGQAFYALSDRGVLVTGRFVRDPQGEIVDMIAQDHRPLLDAEGNRLRGARDDSEGLALADDGRLYVSFEGLSRVRIEPHGGEGPLLLPRSPDFDAFEGNGGFEAVAVGPGGTIYAIPEEAPDGGDFPVYRFRNGAWSVAFKIPRDGGFLPTGADIGPDGRLYVLERAFSGLGFRSRVQRFTVDGGNGVTVLETAMAEHDNLEGISVWADAQGLRMTLIADDNFRFFQQTEVVEYRLDD